MCKKAVVFGFLALGALLVYKKTPVGSYINTLVSNGQRTVKKMVPRQFEIDRVENEIEKLEGEVKALLGPIAEKQALADRLEREITTARANLKDRRERLLALTQKVESGSRSINLEGEEVPLGEAKARLAHDFGIFKRHDAHLKHQEKLLAAQRQNIRLSKEQLDKLSELQLDLRVHLEKVKAAEETLKVEEYQTPARFDRSLVANAKAILNAVEQAQEVERNRRLLEAEYLTRGATRGRSGTASVDPAEVKSFLGVETIQPQVVENK
jgi:hypothetical protein